MSIASIISLIVLIIIILFLELFVFAHWFETRKRNPRASWVYAAHIAATLLLAVLLPRINTIPYWIGGLTVYLMAGWSFSSVGVILLKSIADIDNPVPSKH